AASLSAGTMQIASGTGWLGHEHYDQFSTYFLLLVLLTLTYLLSASTGLHKGIKRLSELNMVLVILLALLVWATLSFTGVFATLWHGLTDYARFLPSLSFAPLESAEQPDWSAKWTANYFLSWIAWVPFVGIFVARISKGRTIREFLSGVVLVPSLFTFIWFAIFATASYDLQNTGVVDLAAAVKEDSGQALFALLSVFPGAEYLFMLVIALVFIFLVTSADSASFVLAMMAGQGIQNPSAFSKLFWGLTIAAMTGATLYSESGIHSVRAVFSFAGIAVFFILIGQMACLIWGLLGHSRTKRNDVEY
ncbi:MAG: BCCT family transporter, partial [Rickettsiales bacterium]